MPPSVILAIAHEGENPHESPSSLDSSKITGINIQPSLAKGTLVLDPSQVTADFDMLRFEAAAFSQLQITGRTEEATHHKQKNNSHSENSVLLSSFLISSPYNNPNHYLDLTTLSPPALIFSKALTALKPIRPDYATAPYTSALNFSTVLELIRKLSLNEGFEWKSPISFYVVIFRSQLKETIDSDLLWKLDYESHREACESGGLLKYWFGRVDAERRNLATCFWRSREDARKGGLGPWHKKARNAARELYTTITFSAHRFTVLEGVRGFEFDDWVD